jgi:3-oxoacyl-[acyl-carrier-protein] synthase II
MNKRVVITGMAGLSPIGLEWDEVFKHLREKKSGCEYIPEWDNVEGLQTRVGGRVKNFIVPKSYPRKKIRSMGRVALLATRATELALEDAGLIEDACLSDGSTGVAYGSSSGSPPAIGKYAKMLNANSIKGITSINYIQMMSHTCAANISLFFGITGRVIPTCSACTSGSQGIGYGYEAIKFGAQKVMITGGAEELSASEAAVFDIMYSTSIKNDTPHKTPSPFDENRDGLVIGEGAGTVILEDMEHALARGANIHAELVGFGTNSDGKHITNPELDGMRAVMNLSLQNSGLPSEAIQYVNTHGTATEVGDITESKATNLVFGSKIPVSSLKSYMGHTLGACGAIETWITVQMMKNKWFAPTINLENIDPKCAKLDYIMHEGREMDIEYAMSNNFAFGGINTSLIFKRFN